MTARPSADSTATADSIDTLSLAVRRLVLLGTPLALAALFWVHPHTGDDAYAALGPVADTWFAVHLLLLPLFGLLGASLYLLSTERRGTAATVGRVGTAVYLVAHTAYEAIVGIGSGIALRAARGLPQEQRAGVEAAVSALFSEPIVVGLAITGTVGCLVAVVAIAASERRAGAPLVPLAALFAAPLGLIAHSGPPGAVLMALFTAGVAWLELGRPTARH